MLNAKLNAGEIVVRSNANTEYGGSESITGTKEFNFNDVVNLNYNKTFGEYTVGAGAYMEYYKAHY